MKCKKSRPNKRAAFCLENYLFCGGLVVQLKCAGKKIRRQPHFAESRSVNANGVFVYDFAVNGKNSAQSVDKRAGAVAAKSSDFPICGKQRALPLFGINGKRSKLSPSVVGTPRMRAKRKLSASVPSGRKIHSFFLSAAVYVPLTSDCVSPQYRTPPPRPSRTSFDSERILSPSSRK